MQCTQILETETRVIMEKAKLDMLVVDMQMGSVKAFDQICRHFHSSLLRFSFKICAHEQMAHDAVQNSWLKMAKSIKSLNDPRAFKSWIYQLVRWQTLDLLQKVNNDVLDFNTDKVDVAVTCEIDHSDLLSLIDCLPTIDRQAVYLFYLEQMTLAEIAIVVEVPIGTVKSRLNRARQFLKNKFTLKE